MSQSNIPCPCNSTRRYETCCRPFHLEQQVPTTPEELMRSRYSAFVKQKHEYLIKTHHPEHLCGLSAEDLSESSLNWIGLEIVSTKTIDNVQGQVTFKAWFLENNRLDAIFECSDFVKVNGRWLYTEGHQFKTKLPERNQPCICQSGKKFKQCCLKKI